MSEIHFPSPLGEGAQRADEVCRGVGGDVISVDNLRNDWLSFSPERNSEENILLLTEIYLQSIARERYSFTAEELETITTIAQQCYLEAGNSVYMARILWMMHHQTLDLAFQDSCVTVTGYYKTQEETDATASIPERIFRLQPNYLSQGFEHDVTVTAGLQGTITFYNNLGQVVAARSYQLGQSKLSLQPPTGYIYYLAIDEDGFSHVGKIVVHP